MNCIYKWIDCKSESPDINQVEDPVVRYDSPDEEVYFERMNRYNLHRLKLLLFLQYYNIRYRFFRNIEPPPTYSPVISPR